MMVGRRGGGTTGRSTGGSTAEYEEEPLNTWYMAHDVWVPPSFVAMLAQANLCRSPPLSHHERPLSAWRLIVEVLDDVCTFKGDDWDFSAHSMDDPGEGDLPEAEEAIVEPAADPSAPTRPPSLAQLQDPTSVAEREGSTTSVGGGSVGPSTSMTRATGR